MRLLKLFCAALGAAMISPMQSAHADFLVASQESHSIEWFGPGGAWIDTFATTGALYPSSVASNPVTHDVVVATFTSTILRYTSRGLPASGCDSGTSTNPVYNVMFDKSGNLYAETDYGTSGYVQQILVYKAPIDWGNCKPTQVIDTGLQRGSQMAFDSKGDICIASFIDEDVRCFALATGAEVADYQSEIQSALSLPNIASEAIEPSGIAFDSAGRLIWDSAFTGDVVAQTTAGTGPLPLTHVTGALNPTLGQLTLTGDLLYVPSFFNVNARYADYACGYYACQDYDFNPDTIYQVNLATSPATVKPFITSHVWGAVQIIQATVTKARP